MRNPGPAFIVTVCFIGVAIALGGLCLDNPGIFLVGLCVVIGGVGFDQATRP